MKKFEYYLLLSEDKTKIITVGCIINLELYIVRNYLMYNQSYATDVLTRIKQIAKGKDQFYDRKDQINFAKKQLELKPKVVKVDIKI